MQIGDKVCVSGTVRDIVEGSVLMVTEDAMHQREYWFLAEHVTVVEAAPGPPPVAAQLPAEEEEGPTRPEPPARPTHPIAPPPPVRPAPTPVRK